MSQNQTSSSSASVSSYRNTASAGSQVYFIDASVPGYEALALSLGENSKVFVIENTSDAFIQIDRALASLSDPASSVHIYSHGRDGAILLGGQWIDEAALSQSSEILKSIGESLTQGADILLYGCNTAASSLGESFIARMARLASVDVAASSNMTGTGGDWTLEKGTGDIETTPTRPGEWLGNLDAGDPISGWGVLEGTANSESITGFVTNDRIYGKGGADTLKGGDGDDAYYISGSGTSGTQVMENANEGTDTVYSMVNSFDLSGGDSTNASAVEYVVLQAQSGMVAQSATGNEFGQTMVGNNLANNLTGKGGNDLLYGYDGDDFLDGGNGKTSDLTSGTDYNYSERNTLVGGKGDDNYIVRGSGDVVVENSNEGTDNVFSFIDYTLGANVENLTLLDGEDSISSARMGVGNALNNVLRGNSFANVLVGGAGNDTLYGSKASDTEADTLIGGVGNDAYYVYSTRDIIDDSAGNDSLYSTADYTLGANIENLFLQGEATVGQGNTLNNRIVGNETLGSNLSGGGGTDTLEGGYGDDTFNLSSSGDMVIDKGGNNTVLSSVTVDLNRFANATIQAVELTGTAAINATAQRTVATNIAGNSGNNVLVGGALNDTLDGGTGGADSLSGGLGDDVYYVRNANTIVTEAVNAGTDTVNASVDYTLTANVENLVLQGDAKVGVGNNLSNVIDGSTINGGILHGGANSTGLAGDTLIGGAGNDQIYSYNANDSITFGGGNDVLYVSYAVDGGADMDAAAWKAYFSARGVSLTDKVTVIYRGNPVAGSGATSGVSINGTTLATNLLGTDKNDTLTAESATATTLDGGKGSDSMVGSSAGDVFYVDSIGATTVAAVSLLGNVGDIVVAGAGNDTIRSSVNIDLNKGYAIGNSASTAQFSDVEVVELQGTAALSATGNLNASTTLIGNAANNKLSGGNSDDVLDGGAGADVMTGGNGNDLYYVDNAGDRVVENAGGGTDSIKTNGISINLGTANFANVEYVENIGSAGISMTGTSGEETIIAGTGGDTLDGKGGSDSIVGGAGNDLIYYYGNEQRIDAGDGMDTLYVKKTAISINNDAVHHFEVVQLESVAANTRAIDINASGATRGMTLIGNAGSSKLEGGAGNDVIIGGGGQDTISAGSGNDFVEISANQGGYGALDGGDGIDTLSFGAGADSVSFAADGSITQVISGKKVSVNATGFEIYSGGAGNDTLDASATTDGRILSGGLGADVLKGGSGSDTLIADGGNDSIYTNGGYDTVKLTKEAVGSSITVMDFDAQLDTISDTDLAGWSKTVTQSGADAIVTYVNPNNSTQKISVTFKNTVGSDIKSGMTKTIADNGTTFSATDVASSMPWQINVTGTGNTVSGGSLNDQMKSSGGNALDGGAGNDEIFGHAEDTLLGGTGDDTIIVSGPTTGMSIDGGAGADVIFVDSLGGSAATSISGGAGDDKFYIDGINASGSTTNSISGGDGNDGLYFSGSSVAMHFTGGGSTEISLDSVTLNGNAGTVSVSGIEYYMGTGGADSVDASGTTYENTSGNFLHYSTNGGNDTYIGGAAIDAVTVSGFNAYSAVKLVGGGDNNDASDTVSFRGNSAVGITLDTNGAVGSLTADGATVGASISGFESFDLTEQNDVFDARGYTAIGTHAASCIYGNGGNDTIKLGDVTAHYQVSAEGGDGNDSVVVGAVASDSLGTVILDGGKGSDTLTFATNKSVALTFSDTAGPALSYYTTTTDSNGNTTTAYSPSGKVSISGFEYYKGSNSGNYFDAAALTSVQGSLALEGGDGHDNFYLGNLASGQVTLAGGKGSDRFHLGSVASGASVFVDGGTDGEAKDKLGFFDQGGSAATNVYLTLDKYGNLGAVSIAGQKANITSSGLNAYTGGNGNDTIDGSAVTSVDNADKVMILEGGSGNDLIKSGNISGGYFQLEGGLGKDTIIGGAGNDRILIGSSTYTDTGNDSITTGDGNDTLVVNALGNGVVSTITDFKRGKDTLDDSALLSAGWARTVTPTSGATGTTVAYTKDSTSFSLNFTNFTDTAFLPSVVSVNNSNFTVSSDFSGQVYGTSGAEEINATVAGACTIYGGGGNDTVNGGGGQDRDLLRPQADEVEPAQRRLDQGALVRGQTQHGAEGDAGRGDADDAAPGRLGRGIVAAPGQQQSHLGDIDPGRGAGGRGDALDPDHLEEGQAQHDVDRHRDQAEAHRRLGVGAGEEGRLQHPRQHEGRHAPAVVEENPAGLARVLHGEGAAGEEAVDQEERHGHQRRRGRGGQGQGEDHGLVGGGLGVVMIGRLDRGGETRQQGDADRHPDQAERELVEPGGDLGPGAAAGHLGGQDAGDEDVDLHRAGGDGAGNGQGDQGLDLRRQLGPAQADVRPGPARAPPEKARLQDAGDGDADRGGPGGAHRIGLRDHRGQHHQVEDGREDAGQDEAPVGVQHPRQQGADGHARQVGHADLGQHDGQLELHRIGGVAGIDDVHQPRHGELGGQGQAYGRRRQGGQGVGGDAVGLRLALAGQGLGVGRDEGRGEGAFGEDPPEQVWEGERGVVGVGGDGGAGAQARGQHEVARQAHEPADQGQPRQQQRRADEAAALRGFPGRGRGLCHDWLNAPRRAERSSGAIGVGDGVGDEGPGRLHLVRIGRLGGRFMAFPERPGASDEAAPARVENRLGPGHGGLLRRHRPGLHGVEDAAEEADPEGLPGHQMHGLQADGDAEVHGFPHLGLQGGGADGIDQGRRVGTGQDHPLLAQAPADHLAVVMLGADQGVRAMVEIPEGIGERRRAGHARIAPVVVARLAGRIARLGRPGAQDRGRGVGPLQTIAPIGRRQAVDLLVQGLEAGELAGRQVLLGDDDEVAVRIGGVVPHREGALQVGPDEVVGERGLGAGEQALQDEVELGIGGERARAGVGTGHGMCPEIA